jgi:hypothetical protein
MDAPDPHAPIPPDPRRTELLLDALKVAVAEAGEHRLFRAGKLAGLFPSRAGSSAAAALLAISDGLLETVRTETRGKIVTEWVRGTPKAVGFVHDHESPKSVLREMREVLHAARAGVHPWMADAKAELAAMSARIEEHAAATLRRLDDLADRVEDALRRAEAQRPAVAPGVGQVVPWALDALEYLDRRKDSGATGDCPLPELFHALRVKVPALAVGEFHDGLKRLHDVRAVRLTAGEPASVITEPEYAAVVDGRLMYWVGR